MKNRRYLRLIYGKEIKIKESENWWILAVIINFITDVDLLYILLLIKKTFECKVISLTNKLLIIFVLGLLRSWKCCQTFIYFAKDIIIVNQASGPVTYQTCVSNVAPGQFAITITNVLGGGGNSSDTLGLNFAIIRVQ